MVDILELDKKAEYHFSYLFISRCLDMYQKWFLETFSQADEKTRKMLIEKVEGSMEIERKHIFTAKKD